MPPKRKRTSPEEVDGAAAAASKEAAQQLPVGAAEAVVVTVVEETLDPASGGGEPAIKKARGEEPNVIPGSPPPPGLSEISGSDEGALCIDALAAVCEWVGSTADLVRLSCVSRTWRQLVARDGLWRRRFIAERGRPAHDAFALALDLHGHAALASFLGCDHCPPALPVDSAVTAVADGDGDGGGAIKIAGVGVKETEEGGHGLGVWFEAFISTGASPSTCRRDGNALFHTHHVTCTTTTRQDNVVAPVAGVTPALGARAGPALDDETGARGQASRRPRA
jgi:hypothetical protein